MILGIEKPGEVTPEERFREVAAILAVGYLRLRRQSGYCANIVFNEQEQVGDHTQLAE